LKYHFGKTVLDTLKFVDAAGGSNQYRISKILLEVPINTELAKSRFLGTVFAIQIKVNICICIAVTVLQCGGKWGNITCREMKLRR